MNVDEVTMIALKKNSKVQNAAIIAHTAKIVVSISRRRIEKKVGCAWRR